MAIITNGYFFVINSIKFKEDSLATLNITLLKFNSIIRIKNTQL
jgi:hypothetical protein